MDGHDGVILQKLTRIETDVAWIRQTHEDKIDVLEAKVEKMESDIDNWKGCFSTYRWIVTVFGVSILALVANAIC